jgi:hypothetical protein
VFRVFSRQLLDICHGVTIANPSYRRSAPFVVTDQVARVIAGAIGEIDLD